MLSISKYHRLSHGTHTSNLSNNKTEISMLAMIHEVRSMDTETDTGHGHGHVNTDNNLEYDIIQYNHQPELSVLYQYPTPEHA
jgi:hypothetical protein